MIQSRRHVIIGAPWMRVLAPRSAALPGWWVVAGVTCIAAYQPKGAADIAASYVNLANPGTYDAAPGVAPTWDALTGWTGDATTRYLNTGLYPTNVWTMIVQFSGVTGGLCCGVATSGQRFSVRPVNGANRQYYYASGGPLVAGAIAPGNMAIAGGKFYCNGVVDTAPMADAFTCTNNARLVTAYAGTTLIGNVLAVAFYSGTLSAPQVASVSAAMAAL